MSNVETMTKLSLVVVILEDSIISAYHQELEEIQDKYYTVKLNMVNVFIPNYESMAAILDAYKVFKSESIESLINRFQS